MSSDPSVRDRFLEDADRKIKINENGAVKEVRLADAVRQAEAVAALKGSTQAQKSYLEREERYRQERTAHNAKENQFWQDYIANYPVIASANHQKGIRFPNFMPHPDDIEFAANDEVLFRGGDPAVAAKNRECLVLFRDACMMQSAWDERNTSRAANSRRLSAPIFLSNLFFSIANSGLPERFRLDDVTMIMKLSRYAGLTKRELYRRFVKGGRHSAIRQTNQLA